MIDAPDISLTGYQRDGTVLIYGAISQAVCCTDKVNYVCTTLRRLIFHCVFLFFACWMESVVLLLVRVFVLGVVCWEKFNRGKPRVKG